MRLPQSSGQSLSIRFVSITILVALVSGLPPLGHASTQQLVCSPTSLKFGSVTLGQLEPQLVTVANVGTTSATISSVNVNGSEFSVSGLSLPVTITAGQSIALNVTFAPTVTGWTGGKVTFISNASNPTLQLPVGGSGVTSEALSATPATLSFGQVAIGGSSTLSVVLTNTRAWKENLTAFQIAGTGYSVSGPVLPVTLGPGQSVTVAVTFTPQAAGVEGGGLLVSGPSLNIPLTGTGSTTGQLALAPTALNFDSTQVGTTATQPLTLSAPGAGVTVSSAASSNSQFAIPGVSFPLTISAGQTVQLNVTFTPKTTGTSSASLSFSSNASNSSAQEALAGIGAAPYVNLSWSPSTSQVAGYNIYRGAAPGAYSKINTSLDPNAAFTDSTVASGTTYYYAATAVDSSGQESSYSAPVQVVVP